MDEERQTLTGTIENVVFRNDGNGWTVLELDCGGELVTVVGEAFQAAAGDELTVTGCFVEHPSYGRQFKAEVIQHRAPETVPGMLKYLSSGAIRGLGPALARRVVDLFGKDTFRVLEETPEALARVHGISPKKAGQIGAEFKSQFGMRSALLFFQQYGVGTGEAIRIWKALGPSAVEAVRQNPYVLCSAGIAIGFEKADSIAMEMGLSPQSPLRLRAGLLHVLRHNLYASGHTCVPEEKLASAASRLLSAGEEEALNEIDALVDGGELAAEVFAGRRYLFLPGSHDAEAYIAGRLWLMLSCAAGSPGEYGERIAGAEREFGITYAEKQRAAIETACEKGLMILTGGPGTGKTTAINGIIRVYEQMGLKVALCAPTGRAAKRMSEVTGREAKTIHRLLEIEYNEGDVPRFARCERNPLTCDALIVDEFSMVDVLLLESLLRALRLSCRLVLVGDADQLPPVGPGNALRDMAASGLIPVVTLSEIFRQASQSLIVLNAHCIVRGEMPDLSCRDRDFFLLARYTPAQVARTVRKLAASRLPAAYGYSPMWDIQVLAPGRKGELGTLELNRALQEDLNPPGPGKAELRAGGMLLREGDKVMQVKNNYDIPWRRQDGGGGAGVFNGDIGVLEHIDRRTGAFEIRFEDKTASYAAADAEEVEPAYAITVHKSQGSEFRAVILPLFTGAPQLFYRNLLYTAVTRARELVVVVGRESTVQEMVRNSKKTRRYTALLEFLKRQQEPV